MRQVSENGVHHIYRNRFKAHHREKIPLCANYKVKLEEDYHDITTVGEVRNGDVDVCTKCIKSLNRLLPRKLCYCALCGDYAIFSNEAMQRLDKEEFDFMEEDEYLCKKCLRGIVRSVGPTYLD